MHPASVERVQRCEALNAMDVGVMPLPENSWTRGKCAYKAIQYMASGIPVIAADVGVTRHVVGEGGVVANARGDWVDALLLSRGTPTSARRWGAPAASAQRRTSPSSGGYPRWPGCCRVARQCAG